MQIHSLTEMGTVSEIIIYKIPAKVTIFSAKKQYFKVSVQRIIKKLICLFWNTLSSQCTVVNVYMYFVLIKFSWYETPDDITSSETSLKQATLWKKSQCFQRDI
jgi:hypothetical protein